MIAAGIYGVALVISEIRVREVALLAGPMKMLGVSGGMLGILDLVRKKKPHDPKDLTPDRMDLKVTESDK